MKNPMNTTKRFSLFKAVGATLFALFTLLVFCLPSLFDGGRYALTVDAASGYVMQINNLDVEMHIGTDRKITVVEQITMTPNRAGSKFRRSLPIEGRDRYYGIQASCQSVGENETFDWYVEDGENDYLHIVCELYTPAGTSRQYTLSYTMEIGADDFEGGMQLDVIGFGWGVPLQDVDVTMHFPAPATIANDGIIVGAYGSSPNTDGVDIVWSENHTRLDLHAERLDVEYNQIFEESMAKGITVRFTLPTGTLADFWATRIFTVEFGILLALGVAVVALAVCIRMFMCKKRELITVVNIKAPDEMDPMKMGKLLDGTVDSEDITSMVYYFAHKGYLHIDLTDENDPVLVQRFSALPAEAAPHEKTLFAGLFAQGNRVSVSMLEQKFYKYVDKARLQIPNVRMYDKKSQGAFLLGGLLGILFAVLSGVFFGWAKIGGGYGYWGGVTLALPVCVVIVLSYVCETRRYKWKNGTLKTVRVIQAAIVAVSCLVYMAIMGNHVMTESEKIVVCLVAVACAFITSSALSRDEKYNDTLGQIVGFKDFIIVTEEDKIKFMLQEDPQLYFKILPYAQVLGVTNEWENKFRNILIEPPQWCSGYTGMSAFDYYWLNRSMNRAMLRAMSRPQEKSGGSFSGRSGGGGSFGGFGGGGHGGGGGSWS